MRLGFWRYQYLLALHSVSDHSHHLAVGCS